MNQFKTILNSLDLLIEHNLWPDKKPSRILTILMYLHSKGWLYTPTIDGNINAVIGAYRIPDLEEKTLLDIPKEEKGNILYVPFALSLTQDKNIFSVVRESLRIYLSNNPDITQIVLEDKNNQIKKFSLRGEHDGKR